MSEKPLNTNEHLTRPLNQLKAANVSVGMSRESGTKQDKLISMSVVMLDYERKALNCLIRNVKRQKVPILRQVSIVLNSTT